MIEIRTLASAASALAAAIDRKTNDAAAIVAPIADPTVKAALGELLATGGKAPSLTPGGKLGDATIETRLSEANAAPSYKLKNGDQELVAKAIPGATALDRSRAILTQIRAAAASSPHVAKPIGFHVENGFAFAVRPFVPGVTLARIMALLMKEEVPPDSPTWRLAAGARGGGANVTGAKIVCRFGLHVAEALEALNAQQAIHGAIKPENLVCDDTVKPTLTDAGIGAPIAPYEAPEVLAATDRAAARNAHSDLYALGALMYFGLTRHSVFEGDVAAMERATQKDKPQSPLKFNFKASNEMSTITLALLEKDPSKRYANAKELREDLDRYHTNLPIQRKGPGLFSRLFG